KNILFPQFAKDLAHTIHELFFQSKNALPRRDRLDFIELFYLLIQLKIVDVVRPDAMSFSCKDGLDVGLTNSIECLLVAKLLSGQNLTQSDVKSLTLMLFGLPLLLRGRNLFSDRFHRLLNVLKLMEAVSQEQGKKEFLLALVSRLAPLMETDVSAVI
ncbi:MAG TPA: hypothetical protein VN457_06450, partial [Chlamydiales bacterium]|nr:hypothetical protein [Chlamydiales bacterium]